MRDRSKSLQLLADRFDLSGDQAAKLETLAASSVALEISGTAIASVEEALDVHIADSLAGLEVPAVKGAESIVDIGSGVGFPGLVLAAVLPGARVTLVDSVRKKMEAAGHLARQIELENIECVWARVEEISAIGSPAREAFDVVTSRALAPLTALVEYSAPLLKIGGTMVAWKGEPDPAELADARAAETALGFDAGKLEPTKPFKGSARRHFYVASKLDATPDKYPRRAGAALRKPISA
jgi:16S rRNA (guanine527-N7)-methyltransferase